MVPINDFETFPQGGLKRMITMITTQSRMGRRMLGVMLLGLVASLVMMGPVCYADSGGSEERARERAERRDERQADREARQEARREERQTRQAEQEPQQQARREERRQEQVAQQEERREARQEVKEAQREVQREAQAARREERREEQGARREERRQERAAQQDAQREARQEARAAQRDAQREAQATRREERQQDRALRQELKQEHQDTHREARTERRAERQEEREAKREERIRVAQAMPHVAQGRRAEHLADGHETGIARVRDLTETLRQLHHREREGVASDTAPWAQHPYDTRGQGNMGQPDMRDPYGFDKESDREGADRGRPIDSVEPVPTPEPDSPAVTEPVLDDLPTSDESFVEDSASMEPPVVEEMSTDASSTEQTVSDVEASDADGSVLLESTSEDTTESGVTDDAVADESVTEETVEEAAVVDGESSEESASDADVVAAAVVEEVPVGEPQVSEDALVSQEGGEEQQAQAVASVNLEEGSDITFQFSNPAIAMIEHLHAVIEAEPYRAEEINELIAWYEAQLPFYEAQQSSDEPQQVTYNLNDTIGYTLNVNPDAGLEGSALQVTMTLTSVNEYDSMIEEGSVEEGEWDWQYIHYDPGQVVIQTTQEVTVDDQGTFVFSYDPPQEPFGYGDGAFQVAVTVTDPSTGQSYTTTHDKQVYLFRCPYGIVYDHETGEPIAGATVTVHNVDGSVAVLDKAANPNVNNPQVTDATGRYNCKLAIGKKYYLQVVVPGYAPYQSQVFSERWHIVREDVGLTRAMMLSEAATPR